MALGIPAKFAPLLLTRALSRQLFVYAACSLATAEVALIAMGMDAQAPSVVWAALLFLFPGLMLVVLMYWSPKPWVAGAYLLSTAGALFFVARAVLVDVPNAPSTALAPFALVSIAMTLASGAAATVRGRVAIALAGVSLSMFTLWAAAMAAQGEFRVDARAIIGALVIVGIAFIVPGQVSLATKGQAAFDASLAVIEEDGERANINREAIARLHDTLLADLTVLTKIKPAPLSKDMRAMLERELAHLVSTDWLVTAIEESAHNGRQAREPSPVSERFLAAIDANAAQGLDISITGDISALNPLSSASMRALTAAIGQCLSNVMAHAHISHVDVIILGSGDAATITVIDGGAGFEPDAIAVDRLGLRVSVRSRIESVGGFVTIWSTPGQGTAIMLQLPYGYSA